jgi:hypothetical protein
MGLDVWFREDVARVLRAACVAGREAYQCLSEGNTSPAEERGAPSREMAAYWRGYEAALATIGAAFGLASPGLAETRATGHRPAEWPVRIPANGAGPATATLPGGRE